MRRMIILLAFCAVLALPVRALELEAPDVPREASVFMPEDPQNLAQGIREVLLRGLHQLRPDLKEAAQVCVSTAAVVMLLSLIRSFPGSTNRAVELSGVVCVALVLLGASHTMIHLAADTVGKISDYGKLFLPVMTAALASQGGVTAAAAIYTGTAVFDALLAGILSSILVPMIYGFLALSVAGCAIGADMLKKIRDGLRGLMTWLLKTLLYVFTGYITVTGVVSGTTDASVLKAAKLTISGMVPVVGGILSDASEAVLVGAGTVKNAVGLYGMFAVIALWIGPFIQIGAHYLMFRLTSLFCSVFGSKNLMELIQDFAAALGLLLGMTGAGCMMLLISTICFMKGVA